MFMCTHVCMCVRRHAHMCLCACIRVCHLVSADLGPFGPVGFVVVFETRVNICSALAFKSPTRMPPGAVWGWKHSASVMHVTSASAQYVHSS